MCLDSCRAGKARNWPPGSRQALGRGGLLNRPVCLQEALGVCRVRPRERIAAAQGQRGDPAVCVGGLGVEGVWVQEGVWRGVRGRGAFLTPSAASSGLGMAVQCSPLERKGSTNLPESTHGPAWDSAGSAASVQIAVRCRARHHPKGCSPHASHSADAAHLAFQTPAQKGRICASNN